MVHALHEARRLLAPGATLIDLRPLCVDVPLEIVTPRGSQSAGLVDMSPEIQDDLAADDTFRQAVTSGLLRELRQEFFDFAYYWDTLRQVKTDFEARWKGQAILPEAVYRQARRLCQSHRPRPRLRLRLRMKLSAYRQS
jgi:hypothetical protein